MSDLFDKIRQWLSESHPDSDLSLKFVLVQWENGRKYRASPSITQMRLHEREHLIEFLTESIRELEATTGILPGRQAPLSETGAEKVLLDYSTMLLTSKRLFLRASNTTYLISEIRRPRIESSCHRPPKVTRFSLWETLFGSAEPSIERTYDRVYTDNLVITVDGTDVVVDVHSYHSFSGAGTIYDRKAEFDALGISEEERRRIVSEEHKNRGEEIQGSRDWGARQRHLKRVAEAIGAAIAGL